MSTTKHISKQGEHVIERERKRERKKEREKDRERKKEWERPSLLT